MIKQTCQHFVPKFYLKGFSDPVLTGKLWEVDILSGNLANVHPKKAACQTGFYNLQAGLHGPDDTFEKIFEKIETSVAPIINRIRKGKFSLTNTEKEGLMFFICFQKYRVPLYRAEMEKRIREDLGYNKKRRDYVQFAERLKRRAVFPEKLEDFPEKVEADALKNYAIIESKDCFDKLVGFTMLMKWTFLRISPSTASFITSDNPVGFVGGDKGLEEIQLPISSSCHLLINSNNHLVDGEFDVDPTIVENVNREHLKRVHQFVFCSMREQGNWVICETLTHRRGSF